MKPEWIRPLFLVSAAYDLILGIAFLLAFKPIYARFGVSLPNHDAYVQFAAAVVAIFGIGFWFVAQAPQRNRDIIKMGILLKLSYSTVVLAHYSRGQMPSMWVPFAFLDLLFLVAFVAALRAIPSEPARA